MSPREKARHEPLREAQDRTIRALMSLVDDLTVEVDEEGLLSSTLEHVVRTLGVTGGLTLLADSERVLRAAAQFRAPSHDMAATMELARASLDRERPLVKESDSGGWLAAAPLMTKQRQLGVLTIHDAADDSMAPDLELLEALGKQIGTGLDNARLYAELRASSTRLEAIFDELVGELRALIRRRSIAYPEYHRAVEFLAEAGRAGEIPLLLDVFLETLFGFPAPEPAVTQPTAASAASQSGSGCCDSSPGNGRVPS